MVRMALGGLATARRGITTEEGKDMANNKTQLDRKKADKERWRTARDASGRWIPCP